MTDGSGQFASRRQFLQGLGLVGGVVLAGCANQGDTQSSTQTTSQTTKISNTSAGKGSQTTGAEETSTPSIDFQGTWPIAWGTQRFTNSIEAATHPTPPFTEAWSVNSNTATPGLMDSERIYVERDSVTRALDPANGEEVWRQKNFAPTGVVGDYVVSQSPKFGVLEAESGDRVRGPIGSGEYLGFYKYAWSPDWVYGFDNPGNGTADVVRLHDLESGDKRWETGIPEDTSYETIRPQTGYAASTGTVFADAYNPEREEPGILMGIDVKTGDVRWTADHLNSNDGGEIWGIVDDAVLLRSNSGNDNYQVRAISHDTGETLWELPDDTYAYTIIGDVLVQDSDSTFTGYDLRTGEKLWEVNADVGNSPRSFGRGGRLYVGGTNRDAGEFVTKVYNMDGEMLWEETGIAVYRATDQALFGIVGGFDNYQVGLLVEE
jgi:hypothetical protein